MNVFYIDLYFKDNETGKPFRMSTSEIAYSKEFALQKAYFSAQQIEREYDMTLVKTEFKGVFTK